MCSVVTGSTACLATEVWGRQMSVRALLVDDHPVIRGALVTSLVSLGVFESVDTADCFNKLIEMLEHDAQLPAVDPRSQPGGHRRLAGRGPCA
jgi:hypothetical protein